MGAKLMEYYDRAHKLGGFVAQMRMAMLTQLPSNKAKLAFDSAENIRKFEKALIEIKKNQK